MDWQYLFNLVGGGFAIGIGWWCRQIWDSVQKLKEDVKQIEIDLPTHYIKKDEADPARLIELYCAKRMEFLESLKTFIIFGKGWSRRVAEVKQAALAMAQGTSQV